MPYSTRQHSSARDDSPFELGLSLVTNVVLSGNLAANMKEMWKYEKNQKPDGM